MSRSPATCEYQTGTPDAKAGQMVATYQLTVLVPGLFGTELAAPDGRQVWGPDSGPARRYLTEVVGLLSEELVPNRVITDPVIVPGVWSTGGLRSLVDNLERDRRIDRTVLFPYDWRASTRAAATELLDRIASEVAALEASRSTKGPIAVHAVAVGTGALVVEWASLIDPQACDRITTIGSPAGGSIAPLSFMVQAARSASPLSSYYDFRSLPALYDIVVRAEHRIQTAWNGSARLEDLTFLDQDLLEQSRIALSDLNETRGRMLGPGPSVLNIVGGAKRTPVLAILRRNSPLTMSFGYGAGDGLVPLGENGSRRVSSGEYIPFDQTGLGLTSDTDVAAIVSSRSRENPGRGWIPRPQPSGIVIDLPEYCAVDQDANLHVAGTDRASVWVRSEADERSVPVQTVRSVDPETGATSLHATLNTGPQEGIYTVEVDVDDGPRLTDSFLVVAGDLPPGLPVPSRPGEPIDLPEE